MGFFSSIGNVFSDAANAVGHAGASVGAAVISPVTGALNSAAPAVGNAISGVAGPGGKNLGAIAAIGGAALGDPAALGGLGGLLGSNSNSPTAPASVVLTPPAVQVGASSPSISPVVIIGGIAALGIVLLLVMRKR